MQKSNLNRLPTLALNFNDLASVRSIIRAYITYTRRVSKPTRERDEQIHVLESLYLRLTNMPGNVADMALLLSVVEVAALDRAPATVRPCGMSNGCARRLRECYKFCDSIRASFKRFFLTLIFC